MVSDHISAGHAVGAHTGKRRIGTVAVFNDTAGRRHNITHAKDLTGIDIMDKFLNIIICRICKHLLRRIDLHHSAVAQDTYSVTKLKGFVDIMGNENNSFTHAFLDPQQLKLQIVFDQRIKRRKSFIHQKYIRIISKRPGYTYTLFHPA